MTYFKIRYNFINYYLCGVLCREKELEPSAKMGQGPQQLAEELDHGMAGSNNGFISQQLLNQVAEDTAVAMISADISMQLIMNHPDRHHIKPK